MKPKAKFRRTKIVCTLGPATSSPEMILKLIDEGMDVARLNFSHGDHEQHRQTIRTVRSLSRTGRKGNRNSPGPGRARKSGSANSTARK